MVCDNLKLKSNDREEEKVVAVISLPHPENGNKLSGEKRMDKNADKTGLRKGIERREKSPYPKGDPF